MIANKTRAGGDFRASCTEDPFEQEECAPYGAMIAYDHPDWSCHGDICPEASSGTCEEPDGDEDGIADAIDNCPEVQNTDQADGDGDGVGDACDDPPSFVLMHVFLVLFYVLLVIVIILYIFRARGSPKNEQEKARKSINNRDFSVVFHWFS